MYKLILNTVFLFQLILASGFGQTYKSDSLLNKLYTTTLPSEQINLNNLLAEVYLKSNPDKSEEFARQALFLAESINSHDGKAKALYYLAILESDRMEYEKAINHLETSMNYLKYDDDEFWLAKVYIALSEEYKRKLEFEKALELAYHALDIYTNLKLDDRIADTYMKIGGNYYDKASYDKAAEYFEKSLTYYSKLGKSIDIAEVTHNIGEVLRISGHPDDALKYFRKALIEFKKSDNILNSGFVFNNIGSIYLSKRELDSAAFYLKKSYAIATQQKNPRLMSSVNINKGNYYLAREAPDSARYFFYRALNLANMDLRTMNIRDASLGLSKVYELLGSFDSAYFYHNQYKLISDSIIDIRNQHKITQIEMNYLYDHEQQLSQIQQQNILLRYFTIVGGLFFFLVILVLFYGRQRIKVKHLRTVADSLKFEQQQLQEELDLKNRELTTHVMYLVKKNELINFISEKLYRTKSFFTQDNKKKLQRIIVDLQEHIDKNIWNLFEQRFKDVHTDFYKKLNEQFPNLTENEKKLCAFLKLNLTTKEISLILHLNPGTVEVARTRLRKKLDIAGKDISLTSFLSQL